MNIYVNGEARSFDGVSSVHDLLVALGLTGQRIAVECNGEIVPRSRHAEQTLAEGDRLEVVVAVGGG
ncbi:thiamine biosynthesis protein ThiS [Crenobacter luteus]|uniref:Thiamine biosynthesis protein ThiS n=1 Tax=Crenobacter luteus TaxID=1452487 RepID=A0A163CCM5_9NEIS|nr:thiamine biosynthesis protein ThiS [Crenobacter luteus]